jgi:LAO/AO transport system kinase
MNLVAEILSGNRLALARLLTKIENDSPEGVSTLDALFPYTGKAYLIGVTGAPGTGKSSLVNQLALHFRKTPGKEASPRVAVVAVDPSSPFSGGAILGDRIRMRDLSGDPDVFIRSMASRGVLGGIAQATASVVQALDAAGYGLILIETVGAGQAEVDIARLAHTTLVVEAPGMGDDIQAIKAGILEIADILVINKADRPGIENTETALRNMLQLGHPLPRDLRHHGKWVDQPVEADKAEIPNVWLPPIVRTVATEGKGIPELAEKIYMHKQYLHTSGEWETREQTRLETELINHLKSGLLSHWRNSITDQLYQDVLEKVYDRKLSPRQAVTLFLESEYD